ncbi:hypothetical protein FRACYDRAFT_242051 [Fragilariopsis cylindrus CCMP1102]|uniref:SCP2 domain-containing protein n=1 Tax=Fragilariopsis cylindrus CCMP1102 TaxID=635003 RepID=A0A1E7F687_9STRA|nr:hypothetical protein FRACYDRAFT_242051 [Fragilariopsis cylindrus CCMP1102]|eukprot:OEU13708.1 hypothetical protein FRACYDRAFT_242051 [Fragilariopsis cylindrus CCMP1102]
MMKPDAESIVAAMKTAVKVTPSLKSRFNAVVEFRISEDGGNVVKERIDISKKKKNDDDAADLIVTINAPTSFMQGKLKIKGNMALAMKLALVLNATRKVLLDNKKKPLSKL